MNELELAWASGLFDGEGSTFLKRKQRRTSASVTLCVQLAQSGKDTPTLERFVSIVGVGRTYGPYQGSGNRAPKTYWTAHGNEALHVLHLLWPHLTDPKREQAKDAIEKWDSELRARVNPRSDARVSASVSLVERTLVCQS